MGSGSSKKIELSTYTQSEIVETDEHKSSSNSTAKRMARGAFMVVNPAGALTMRAINSAKNSNMNNNVYSTTNDGS